MEEGRRDGPPGASAPTGRTGAGARLREGQAPPLRRRVYLDAERTAGRRGRRPLRGGAKPWVWVRICGTSRTPSPTGAKPFVSVVGAAALGRPRTWRKAGETGRRGRRPLRRRTGTGANLRDVEDAVPYGCAADAGFRRRGGRPRPPADMEEGRRNGPPGASAPTEADGGGCESAGGASPSPTGWCEYQAWCVDRGRGKPLPYGVVRSRGVRRGSAGRRGRRPLRGGAKPWG